MAPRVTSLLHYSSSPGGCHNFTVTQGEAVLWNNILIVSKNIHLLYLISCGSGSCWIISPLLLMLAGGCPQMKLCTVLSRVLCPHMLLIRLLLLIMGQGNDLFFRCSS